MPAPHIATYVLLLASLTQPAAFAQAYKCKVTSRTVRYQQIPCSTVGEDKVRLTYESNPDDAAAAAMPNDRRIAFESLIGQRKVALGMSAGMVRRCWEEPKKINASMRERGRSEQWVYESEYVYLENGIVSSIQTGR